MSTYIPGSKRMPLLATVRVTVTLYNAIFFKGLILIVVISAILLFCFILNHYFEIFYLKKINDKINSLYIDLKNIELEKEIEEENKKAKKIEEEIEHYFNKE